MVIWINIFSKKWSGHSMTKRWFNHFHKEGKVAHNDVPETFSKILYDFNSDCPIINIKHWVYQDYSWVQTKIQKNVQMDDILCEEWSNSFWTKRILTLFAKDDINIGIFGGPAWKVCVVKKVTFNKAWPVDWFFVIHASQMASALLSKQKYGSPFYKTWSILMSLKKWHLLSLKCE